MAVIAITWKAFQHYNERPGKEKVTTGRFDYDVLPIEDKDFCEMVYTVTNLQDELVEFGKSFDEISLWYAIKAILPANRTHTSLSVGDEVQIDDRLYVVDHVGFRQLACAECR